MEERTHGGDIYGLERPVLDLSISLNPWGCRPAPSRRRGRRWSALPPILTPLPWPKAGHLRPGRRSGGLGAVWERGL